MFKYIDSEIAITMYKEMILPPFDYADFMVESVRKYKVEQLEKSQEQGICYVDNDMQFNADIDTLYCKFNVQRL